MNSKQVLFGTNFQIILTTIYKKLSDNISTVRNELSEMLFIMNHVIKRGGDNFVFSG